MNKKNYLITFLLLTSLFSQAQKEGNLWYFGDGAGLDFNSGSPVSVSGGQTMSDEGTATISDANGNLLFYTEGVNVWNSNHVLMPNGTGLNGNMQTTQSALIVKQPGNNNIYYIFTAPVSGSGSYCYSIVDMTLAGGLGDVTTKNFVLYANASERSTAVRMPNGIDFWIIGHEFNNNTFFAYQLTAAGVSAVPVLSSLGVMQTNGGDEIGYLKASPDGTKLALAVRYENLFEIYDFDKSTGVLSNVITFPATYPYAYSVAFSPDGSKLYMSGGLSTGYIYQVDMNAGSPAAIIASASMVSNPPTAQWMWALQLGPDCKIYAGHYQSTSLGVINDPNETAALCNYVDNQITLTSGTCMLGLPNFFEMNSCSALSFTPTCVGDSTYFSLGNVSSLAAASWDFGDPLSGINNTSSVFNPVHYYANAGTYTIQLIRYSFNGSIDTSYAQVIVNALPANFLGNDTTICTGTNLLIDATGFSSYLWNDGSTNATLTVTDSGLYQVTVNDGVCNGTDSIYITTVICAQPVIAVAASDTSFCEKQCIDFTDLSTNTPTSWQWFFQGASPDTSTSQNPTGICYNSYGSFDVKLIACNSNGCDSITITNFITEYQNPVDSIYNSNDTLWSLPFPSYQWYEISAGLIAGATNQFFIASNPGNYYCVVNDSIGCIATSNTIVATAIQSVINNSQFSIFPNPNNGDFEIIFNSNYPFADKGELRILNTLGQIVFNQKLNSKNLKLSLDVEEGIYFLLISFDKKQYQQKLIIKK